MDSRNWPFVPNGVEGVLIHPGRFYRFYYEASIPEHRNYPGKVSIEEINTGVDPTGLPTIDFKDVSRCICTGEQFINGLEYLELPLTIYGHWA